MTVVIYERPEGFCQSCRFVKNWLDRRGIPYEVEPLTDEVRDEMFDRGHLALPIVVHNGRAHSGVKVHELERIAQEHHFFTD